MDVSGRIYELSDEQLDYLNGGASIHERFERAKDAVVETFADVARLDGYLRGRSDEARRGAGVNRDLSKCGRATDRAVA